MTAGEILAQPTCSVDEAASVIGVSRSTVYEAIRRGDFPGVLKVGRRVRVSTASLKRWLEGHDGGPE